MTECMPMQNLDEIKKQCQDRLSYYATAGAVNAINPLPGIDVGIDAGICLKMMFEIREKFGLDNAMEAKLRRYELLLPLVKKVFDYATKEGVALLLKAVAKRYLGKTAAKYVPIVGQGIAAAAGYGMMKYFGSAYINDCYELAQKMGQLHDDGEMINVTPKKEDRGE